MTGNFDFLNRVYAMLLQFAPKVVLAVILLWGGSWIINRAVDAVAKTMRARRVDATIRPFFTSMVNVLLKAMLAISVAGLFGIQTTSFVAIFGAASLAIGLALQGSLGHFASGVILLIFEPYRVGDTVTLNGQTGTVEAIQIFNTILCTTDNKRVFIPNGLVTSNIITNISAQGFLRVEVNFSFPDKGDIEQNRALIKRVVDVCPLILSDRPTDILVGESGPDVVTFIVRAWTKSGNYWSVYYYLQENIRKATAEKANVTAP